jgi:hypothetical protein
VLCPLLLRLTERFSCVAPTTQDRYDEIVPAEKRLYEYQEEERYGGAVKVIRADFKKELKRCVPLRAPQAIPGTSIVPWWCLRGCRTTGENLCVKPSPTSGHRTYCQESKAST